MTQSTFEAFGFAEPLSRALQQCGYATPTAIQSAALPPQLEGADLLALAETGSGKTAAFLLPILQQLAAEPKQPEPRNPIALILAPTRELVLQIDGEVASLARNMPVRRAVVLGGVGKGPQISAMRRGVHILVATPGRLLDLVSERHADLSKVQMLVLDEADRMFDMGFIRDIRKIVSMMPRDRQTTLFSATMPPEVRALAQEVLQSPVRIDLSPKQVVVDRIEQKVMFVRSPEKQSRLHTILKDEAASRVIVFTRTKRGADKVTARLAMAGIGASAIHGNKAQNARQRALADFSAGHVRVLVATDIAARGIDVSDVSHVVNFEMPMEPETYVHRIGRTARKGTTGVAISLCDPSEKPEITAIERLMKQKIAVIDDVGGEAVPMPERQPRETSERPSFGGQNRRGRAPERDRSDRESPDRQRRDRGDRPDRDRPDRDHFAGERPERERSEGDRPFRERSERGSSQHSRGGNRDRDGFQKRERKWSDRGERPNQSRGRGGDRPDKQHREFERPDRDNQASGYQPRSDANFKPRDQHAGDASPTEPVRDHARDHARPRSSERSWTKKPRPARHDGASEPSRQSSDGQHHHSRGNGRPSSRGQDSRGHGKPFRDRPFGERGDRNRSDRERSSHERSDQNQRRENSQGQNFKDQNSGDQGRPHHAKPDHKRQDQSRSGEGRHEHKKQGGGSWGDKRPTKFFEKRQDGQRPNRAERSDRPDRSDRPFRQDRSDRNRNGFQPRRRPSDKPAA